MEIKRTNLQDHEERKITVDHSRFQNRAPEVVCIWIDILQSIHRWDLEGRQEDVLLLLLNELFKVLEISGPTLPLQRKNCAESVGGRPGSSKYIHNEQAYNYYAIPSRVIPGKLISAHICMRRFNASILDDDREMSSCSSWTTCSASQFNIHRPPPVFPQIPDYTKLVDGRPSSKPVCGRRSQVGDLFDLRAPSLNSKWLL